MPESTLSFSLKEEPLDITDASTFLYNGAAGGVSVFAGVTRQWTKGRQTKKLHYECYASMALKEMEALLKESCAKWPVVKAFMQHRLGEVPLGEPSVLIGVATPHRAEAFEACRYLIDELKVRVPIWKREYYADGTEEWVTPGGG